MKNPIGVFDSGYGGLTVLQDLVTRLPQYDYLYLGDNARAPYGPRSFDTIYAYTLQCVQWFFEQGCQLVILACNTASAKALRSIQQQDLPFIAPNRRVLGVIRPTSEVIGTYSANGHVAVLGTSGTVQSNSYGMEIEKFFPNLTVTQEACPMWVPLIENNEQDGPGADYFVQKHLQQVFQKDPQTDCLLLACTHYPLIINKIKQYCPENVRIVSQGPIVAESLADYLNRHPEIDSQISQSGRRRFFTTGDTGDFDAAATAFYGAPVQSEKAHL